MKPAKPERAPRATRLPLADDGRSVLRPHGSRGPQGAGRAQRAAVVPRSCASARTARCRWTWRRASGPIMRPRPAAGCWTCWPEKGLRRVRRWPGCGANRRRVRGPPRQPAGAARPGSSPPTTTSDEHGELLYPGLPPRPEDVPPAPAGRPRVEVERQGRPPDPVPAARGARSRHRHGRDDLHLRGREGRRPNLARRALATCNAMGAGKWPDGLRALPGR
jgi:hypothetical protein